MQDAKNPHTRFLQAKCAAPWPCKVLTQDTTCVTLHRSGEAVCSISRLCQAAVSRLLLCESLLAAAGQQRKAPSRLSMTGGWSAVYEEAAELFSWWSTANRTCAKMFEPLSARGIPPAGDAVIPLHRLRYHCARQSQALAARFTVATESRL